MNRPADPAPVVVGVDGTDTSAHAVDWASAEAAARGCSLLVVHAFQPAIPADQYGLNASAGSPLTARMHAQSVLDGALARARSVAPDLPISTLLRPGTPARTLLAESAGAQLVVLGARGRSGLRALLARSVSANVSARAPCPVVVIHPAPREPHPPPSPPRVVVGIGASTTRAPAIGFALRAARQRGVPLFAVHAWSPDPPADIGAVSGSPAVTEAVARRTLDRALGRWAAEFPDVPVHTVLVRGDAARALLVVSRGAALTVLGSAGRGRVRGTGLGPVGRSVLRHARGPLAIVTQTTMAAPGRIGRIRRDPPADRRSSRTDDGRR